VNIDRVFLDANILFSIAYGSPGLSMLWKRAEERLCVLFASRYVIEEAKRNLSNEKQINKLKEILSNIQIIPKADPSLPCPLDLPVKDRPVLMAAISARADYLITGVLKNFGKYFGQTIEGVKICTARDYLLKG